jgi:hypothetical protein
VNKHILVSNHADSSPVKLSLAEIIESIQLQDFKFILEQYGTAKQMPNVHLHFPEFS